MPLEKRIIIIFFVMIAIFLCGTAGYVLIEGWTALDSAYMTLITLTSIGFGETHPLSHGGRIFTMFLIVIGMGTLLYGVTSMTAFIVEGQLMDIIRRRRMDRNIKKLKNHYIVCGASDIGKYIIEELVKTKKDFVVVEKNAENIKKLPWDVLWFEGDASEDSVLLNAGIERAKGLIAALSTDKDNVFVVLTARELNPGLKIVSRALEEESIHKLKKAGADSIVSTTAIGGMRMASEMLRPAVTSFLDKMLQAEKGTIRVEEVIVPRGSGINGKALGEIDVHKKIGLTVIAVKGAKSDKYVYNLPVNHKLHDEDLLIVLGSTEQVDRLKELVK